MWSFAAFLVAVIVFVRIFGIDAYATVGAAAIVGGLVWVVGTFIVGVWRGWRE